MSGLDLCGGSCDDEYDNDDKEKTTSLDQCDMPIYKQLLKLRRINKYI